MPPKARITKREIISTAIILVRENGASSLNARAIASALGCSTQPIFSNFSSMDELQEAVNEYAYQTYLDFIKKEVDSGEYPPYKAFGMAYIRFAREEKELFKALFMRDRNGKYEAAYDPHAESLLSIISERVGITVEEARLFHFEMWIFVHGIASMIATGYLMPDAETISLMLTDVYMGLTKRYSKTGG